MAEFQHEKEPLDVVTARALGQFDKLIRWSQHQLGPSGSLFLWLGQEDATKLSADPRFRWGTQVKIPGAERRAILVGSPQLDI
jgi:16S rRNA G527 N7-methylase RsmG